MTEQQTSTLGKEIKGFLFLTVILAPALSIALVGGYGFTIWMYQLFVAPPGAS
jgi:nitrate reductase NapE